jgi:hypothetical protein
MCRAYRGAATAPAAPVPRGRAASSGPLGAAGRRAFTGGVHTIHYADGRYLTGDEVAAAVVDYAEALAREGTAAATVVIPVRDDDGSIRRVELLIGPASQIVIEAGDPSDDELLDPELVARIREASVRARYQQNGTRVSEDHQDGASVPGLEDLDR